MQSIKVSATEIREGVFYEFSNEDHFLSFFFSEKINRFCIEFNAKMIFTTTNFSSAKNKLSTLIEKYNLIQTK